MREQTIEVKDKLDKIVEGACIAVEGLIREWLSGNIQETKIPCMDNDLDEFGQVTNIIDNAVPIDISEIQEFWRLGKDELVFAYEDANTGDDLMEHGRRTTFSIHAPAGQVENFRISYCEHLSRIHRPLCSGRTTFMLSKGHRMIIANSDY